MTSRRARANRASEAERITREGAARLLAEMNLKPPPFASMSVQHAERRYPKPPAHAAADGRAMMVAMGLDPHDLTIAEDRERSQLSNSLAPNMPADEQRRYQAVADAESALGRQLTAEEIRLIWAEEGLQ